jgi:ricin-type beta-trefoil lectin protein
LNIACGVVVSRGAADRRRHRRPRIEMTFRAHARRRLTVTLLGTAVLASIAGLATPAAAATAPAQPRPLPDSPNRVVRIDDELLQPQGSTAGSPLRFATRIGQANDTPDNQTWTQRRGRLGGTFRLVHTPSVQQGGVQLCVDVEGDSTEAGARLVLRPCDGTDSQLWRGLGSSRPQVLQNVESELNMERVRGGVVQNQFPPREDRERARNQLIFVSPKSFGVGGASRSRRAQARPESRREE